MRLLAAALALSMVLGACGDADRVVIRSNEDDVCPLVDRDEVAAIYGVESAMLEEVRFDFTMPTCLVSPDGHEAVLVGWEAVRTYEDLRRPDPLRMNEPFDVEGIGDRAFVVLSDELEDDRASVHFEVDGVTLSVMGHPGTDPLDPSREVRELAGSMATRARFSLER